MQAAAQLGWRGRAGRANLLRGNGRGQAGYGCCFRQPGTCRQGRADSGCTSVPGADRVNGRGEAHGWHVLDRAAVGYEYPPIAKR